MLSLRHWLIMGCLMSLPCVTQADPDSLGGMPERLSTAWPAEGTLQPAPRQEEHVRFAVVGDYGFRGQAVGAVSAMIHSWQPEFIITTGDNTYGSVEYTDNNPSLPGVQTDWDDLIGQYYGDYILRRADNAYASLTGTRQRFYPCPGNHDFVPLGAVAPNTPREQMLRGYLDFFHANPGATPRLPTDRGAVHTDLTSRYALRKGAVDFFLMDSNQSLMTDAANQQIVQEQSDWLKEQAIASTARWKLAVFHHPPPRTIPLPWWNLVAPKRLNLCDAILVGHDHVYERFGWWGLPVLLTGNGGAPLRYRGANPFFPDTQAVDNRRYGALRCRAGANYLVFESRSLDIATRDEFSADTMILGNAAAIPDDEDEYAFTADAGESIQLALQTQGTLQPRITLLKPDGSVAALEEGPTLLYPLTSGGRWKVAISSANGGSGSYRLQTSLIRPGGSFLKWASNLPVTLREPLDDGDHNGQPNLLQYALTTPGNEKPLPGLTVSATRATVQVQFTLPFPLRQSTSLVLESAPSTHASVWSRLLEHRELSGWSSPLGPVFTIQCPSAGVQRILVSLPASSSRLFFRLKATLHE